MNELKGTLFLVGLTLAAVVVGYFVRRHEKKHQQPLDPMQIKNLGLMADDMRKNNDDIAR